MLLVEEKPSSLPSSCRVEPLEWKIVSWSELPPIDVYEATGEVRTGLFVGNDPINNIDPLGLETEVLYFSPVGYGKSAFGHSAVNINGTTYSFGEKGWHKEATSDYMKRNSFRDSYGLVVKLTEEQEKRLQELIEEDIKNNPKYDFPKTQCSSKLSSLLEEVTGKDLFKAESPAPAILNNDLLMKGMVKKVNEYPKAKTFYTIKTP